MSISGLWAAGSSLTAIPSGFELGAPAASYHYAWERCADAGCASPTAIGADAAAYALDPADVGSYVRVGVLAANTCASGCGSTVTAYSAAEAVPDLEWARWPMPDSATIFCMNGGVKIDCPASGSGYGQDGNQLVNSPSYGYTATSSTVLDLVTGLRWQRAVRSRR